MRVGGGGGAARERWHRLAARALDLQQMALPPLARLETRKTHDHAETSRNNPVPHLRRGPGRAGAARPGRRSEEHTSELQSLMRISYAVFCLKKKTHHTNQNNHILNLHTP